MREIKFRAWDTILDEMQYNLVSDIEGGTVNDQLEDLQDKKNLMQYTGLKDKNGKEIYEGDIVKQKPLLVDEEKIGVASIRATQGVCFGEYPYFATPCEVIGNIYENPELIEKL